MKINEVLNNDVLEFNRDILSNDIELIIAKSSGKLVYCLEDVILSGCLGKNIPFKFSSVRGKFNISCNILTSLKGCPMNVGGDFNCGNNELENLLDGPKEVRTNYICTNNKLTSLIGAPIKIERDFMCNNNKLTSLEHCPKHIGSTLYVGSNKIKSLIGIHKLISYCEEIHLTSNPIEDGGIGLLLIKGLQNVSGGSHRFGKVCTIINKYLKLGGGKQYILECQEELEENGFGRYAIL